MVEGTVVKFDTEKGGGRVLPDGAMKDIFIHRNAVKAGSAAELRVGCRVRFKLGRGMYEPKAKDVEVLPPR